MSFDFGVADQIPNMESNPELFNLTTGMEMLSFPSKHNRDANSFMWKEYFTKAGPSSSSATDFYHHDDFAYKPDFTTTLSETTTDSNLIHSSWQTNHTTNNSNRFLEDYGFPSQEEQGSRNMRSQGLSLSLSSNKSSSSNTIGLQTLELIRGTTTEMQDRFLGIASNLHQTQIPIKDSKYLAPCQELLNEFCSLGTKMTHPQSKKKMMNHQWQDENDVAGSSRKHLDLLELQKRKTKLVSMLEEVDRRYRQYCDQMKSVVSSFEAVVGSGAGSVYSALASKAMSRHFRCLRDAIVLELKATSKVMGDKDPVALLTPGTTKGETPRLRLLDQTHRQQKAFRQMSTMESHPWRPQRGLPERSISFLRAWLFEHFLHPYPSDVDKHILARQTGLSRSQVSNWFINARVRLWKPMVEEMYLEETKEQSEAEVGAAAAPPPPPPTSLDDNSCIYQNWNPQLQLHYEDIKPTPDQLVRGGGDTGSLSSIINNPDLKGRDSSQMFGVMDLDFSSYNDQTSNTISYPNKAVSLTLGLQQHGESGNGVNLSFSSPSQPSIFFPRDQVEEYSILDGEVQNPPYRNLMGVQYLHDLAG